MAIGAAVPFTIRPYEEGDFDAITTLCLDSWKSTGLPVAQTETLDYLRQLFSEKLARGSVLHVAIAAFKVVGFVSLYGDKVEQLFTAPAAQGAGVGRQILEFVKAQRPNGFWLTSLVENGSANRFYEREGMKRGETASHEKYGQLVRYVWQQNLNYRCSSDN